MNASSPQSKLRTQIIGVYVSTVGDLLQYGVLGNDLKNKILQFVKFNKYNSFR